MVTAGRLVTRPEASKKISGAPSLTSILENIAEGSTVSIDITGDPRDATLLLSIAVSILKGGFNSIDIGEIVYSNYQERRIFKQNNTFDLISLVNSISVFTEYGRADQLDNFFCKEKAWTSVEAKGSCPRDECLFRYAGSLQDRQY